MAAAEPAVHVELAWYVSPGSARSTIAARLNVTVNSAARTVAVASVGCACRATCAAVVSATANPHHRGATQGQRLVGARLHTQAAAQVLSF